MAIFMVEPFRVNVVTGIAGDRWSMLYMIAVSLSASVVEILNTVRRPCGPACKVPCHVPVMFWANAWENDPPPDASVRAKIDSIHFFMGDLVDTYWSKYVYRGDKVPCSRCVYRKAIPNWSSPFYLFL